MSETILHDAIAWRIRLRDANAEEWEAFTNWLEADPTHLQAYERISSFDADLDMLEFEPSNDGPENREAPQRNVHARRWVIGGIGAAMAAAGAWVLLPQSAAPYTIETAPGQPRLVAIADGSSMHLNGSTRIVLDRSDVRFVRLDQGEILFVIAHDASRQFRVEAGPATIRNLGTSFNVRRDGSSVAVAVAEGAVSFSAARQELKLSAGEAVRLIDGTIETTRLDPQTVGGWRSGELSYSSATLAEIAQDLSRLSGLSVRADPAVAQRRFSGTIHANEEKEQLRRRLGALLGVEIRVAGEEWVMAPTR